MSEKFPYESMPWRLEHEDGPKEGRKKPPIKLCFFHCKENAEKYIKRHKLKKGTFVLECANPETAPKPRRKRSPGAKIAKQTKKNTK